jgi:hypothetical protein
MHSGRELSGDEVGLWANDVNPAGPPGGRVPALVRVELGLGVTGGLLSSFQRFSFSAFQFFKKGWEARHLRHGWRGLVLL